jgi:hypothetical protein
MPGAHIAGIPIEETLLTLGGPAAIYAALLGAVAAFRANLRKSASVTKSARSTPESVPIISETAVTPRAWTNESHRTRRSPALKRRSDAPS